MTRPHSSGSDVHATVPADPASPAGQPEHLHWFQAFDGLTGLTGSWWALGGLQHQLLSQWQHPLQHMQALAQWWWPGVNLSPWAWPTPAPGAPSLPPGHTPWQPGDAAHPGASPGTVPGATQAHAVSAKPRKPRPRQGHA